MNVRVWKAEASQQLGTLLPREKHKLAYDKALLERYKHMDEVRCWMTSPSIEGPAHAFLVSSESFRQRPSHESLPLLQVKRITRHRHLPTAIFKATKQRRVIVDSESKKMERRIAHSKPGSIKVKAERKKKIIAEVE